MKRWNYFEGGNDRCFNHIKSKTFDQRRQRSLLIGHYHLQNSFNASFFTHDRAGLISVTTIAEKNGVD